MDGSLDMAMQRASKLLQERGVQPHVHSPRCRRLTRHILSGSERIIFEAKQSLLESLTPIRMIATDRRIILINPSFWGLYFGFDLMRPTEYSIIPYKYVVGVTILKSKMLTTMKIHTSADVGGKEENEIHGLRTKDAILMAAFVDEVIEYESQNEPAQQRTAERSPFRKEVFSEPPVSRWDRFIWLGAETPEEVAIALGIRTERITKMSHEQLLALGEREIGEISSSVLVSYDGEMAARVSALLKKKFNVEMRVMKGGISGFLESQSRSMRSSA